jgi:hypothetical protein
VKPTNPRAATSVQDEVGAIMAVVLTKKRTTRATAGEMLDLATEDSRLRIRHRRTTSRFHLW